VAPCGGDAPAEEEVSISVIKIGLSRSFGPEKFGFPATFVDRYDCHDPQRAKNRNDESEYGSGRDHKIGGANQK
jgi:hypothetical protein